MIRQSLALNLTCLSLQNDTSFYSYLVKNNISPAGQTNVVANLEQNAPLLTENSPLPKTNKEASREELPLSITNLKASKEELPLPTSCAVTSEEELPLPASCAVAPEEESPEEKMGRFKRKCMVIADTYLLSKRESEVLLLLAKGHNSSTIQKTLYISAGTANTHMRHVYAKLNVHSRQELINLIEEVDFESA
jgi:DNA-binding CsgD family transcriptional regulator